MTTNPATLPSTASVREAARLMRDSNIGDVVVTDANGVCGIVTDRDIVVRAISDGSAEMQLGEICSRDLATVSPDDDAGKVINMMRERALRRVLVMENGSLAGIVSIGDLAVNSNEKSALSDISAAPPNA